MKLAPEPSCILEPSKYRVQILLATKMLPIVLLLLCTSILHDSLALVAIKGRSSPCVSGERGDGYA